VLEVKVRNTDGVESNAIDYALPADAASMDSDGDDLPDDWERNGYDADGDGTIDVDLPGLGADPYRPEVLVEVDIMAGLANPPSAADFQPVIDGFAAAPIVNLGDQDGVNLILDTSGSVPFSQFIEFSGADDPATGLANFYTLTGTNFNLAQRGRLYHYCIWGNMRLNNSSGVAERPGNDCIVSLDDFGAAAHAVRPHAETFMHELGHNLGHQDGGARSFAFNPTYNSVVSYSWQLRTADSDNGRLGAPVWVPFYYVDARGDRGRWRVAGRLRRRDRLLRGDGSRPRRVRSRRGHRGVQQRRGGLEPGRRH
jgi:hypothetical protein